MRVNALILLAAIGLVVGFADPAAAEKVKTNQTTKLLARPGEQAKVIITVKEGQNMTLLAQDGRWLKVRVHGRTGYVPRSKVDLPDDGDIMRNTRRRPFVDGRSRGRGFGSGGPDDRIGADAVGEGQDEGDSGDDEEEDEPKRTSKRSSDDEEEDEEDDRPKKASKRSSRSSDDEDEDFGDDEGSGDEDEEGDFSDDEESGEEEEDARPTVRVSKKVAVLDKPKSRSDVAFTARPDDKLFAIEEKGDWTFVENEDADGGWIRTSDLDTGDSGGGGGKGKRMINVGAQVGLMFIQQGMRTAGSTNVAVPDNYNIGTSSVTIALGAGILVPYGKKYLLGGELTWEYSKTLFGGVFYDPPDVDGMTTPGANIGISVSNVNVRFTPGIDLKKKNGMKLFGHLGYRYQGFLIKDVESMTANPARLPSEVLKGPTIGAALVVPKLTDKIGLKVGLDAMIVGASITQTKGLEDGASPSAKAATICAGIVYRWKPKMDLQANYDLNYTKADFGAPLASSQRNHMGTAVARTDIFHVVTFGVAMPF